MNSITFETKRAQNNDNLVIRVGEKNNFDFTKKEISTLKNELKGRKVFVNSRTGNDIVITADFPSIITINPELSFVEPKGEISNIKACRIKCYLVDGVLSDDTINSIEYCCKFNIPMLFTFMRFRSKKSLAEYIDLETSQEYYTLDSGWQRPNKKAQSTMIKLIKLIVVKSFKAPESLINFCDLKGIGCTSCNNCSLLTYGIKSEVHALNLACSGDNGICKHNCPECWSKSILARTANKRPKCNKVFQNNKQKGKTKHI